MVRGIYGWGTVVGVSVVTSVVDDHALMGCCDWCPLVEVSVVRGTVVRGTVVSIWLGEWLE